MENAAAADLQPVVLMGVSGSGKTTVGQRLAEVLGRVFIDGDDLHPLANKEKMAHGVPLTDEDRWPWLHVVGERLAEGDGVVVACSALRRAYRDALRELAPDTFFALLSGSHDLLAARVAARHHEYMPASLLDSQLATLEPLQADEDGGVFDVSGTVDETVAAIRGRLAAERRAS